mmetsp:Transcript_16164/g.45271  ORF Transcript_16164/g.45271 Transcript_16164/m.45271 type:complete len:367 (+) Transcript_16164:289-1389(+)|eukprot:CAMPEP_0119560586 /NCGR_PEP_ID=MMETSP1352-20130426/15339_1 /TAXON_ID=265584 /ORGANISM="Stauroneis constricta, Strain CCMP1120" /LENGTH=366 /DNA_ID=CAMNT_0007608599 /DNA_START=223 /DNA_END=1323 /DNA_ORIENTATION=-
MIQIQQHQNQHNAIALSNRSSSGMSGSAIGTSSHFRRALQQKRPRAHHQHRQQRQQQLSPSKQQPAAATYHAANDVGLGLGRGLHSVVHQYAELALKIKADEDRLMAMRHDQMIQQHLRSIISCTEEGMNWMEIACLGKAFSHFQRALHMTLHLSASHPTFVSKRYLPSASASSSASSASDDIPRFFSTGEGDVIYHQGLVVDQLLRSVPTDSNPRRRLMLVVVSLLFNMGVCFHLKGISSFDRKIQNASLRKAQRYYAKAHDFLLDAYPALARTTSTGDDTVDFLYLVLVNNLSSASSTLHSRRTAATMDNDTDNADDEPTYAENLIMFAQNLPKSTDRIERCRKTFLLHALLVRKRATNLAPAA